MRIGSTETIMPPGMDPRPNPPFRVRREYDDFKGMEPGATRSYRRKVGVLLRPVDANPFTLIKKNTIAAISFIPAIAIAPAATISGLAAAGAAVLALKKLRPHGDRISAPPVVAKVAHAVTKNAWIAGAAASAVGLVVPAGAAAIVLGLGACKVLSHLTRDPAYDK
jgi:hypothetical protein